MVFGENDICSVPQRPFIFVFDFISCSCSIQMENSVNNNDDVNQYLREDRYICLISNVLSEMTKCSGSEDLITYSQDFGEEPKFVKNHFRSERGNCFVAAAFCLPALCRFIKATINKCQHSLRNNSTVRCNRHENERKSQQIECYDCKYPLALDGVLNVLVELLRDDPAGTAVALVLENVCASLADAIFLFPRSSMYHRKFRDIFSLAVIQGASQSFCVTILSANSEKAQKIVQLCMEERVSTTSLQHSPPELITCANLLTRMITFCELQLKHEQNDCLTQHHFYCRCLMGLMLCCLNIIRLKESEVSVQSYDSN